MTIEQLIQFYEKEIEQCKADEAYAAAHGSKEDLKDAVEHTQEMELLVDALDKQVVKAPTLYNGKEWCRCTGCGNVVRFQNYCAICGQKMKARDEHDAGTKCL